MRPARVVFLAVILAALIVAILMLAIRRPRFGPFLKGISCTA